MTIEFNLVQNILNKLPIGYYLGRSIKVILDPGSESYYAPSKDIIVIGYQLIEDAFKHINPKKRDQYNIEEIIRGLLYHEISHVILTPDLYSHNSNNRDIINIFEDERIEVLLKSFYMNTNFRKNVIFLNQVDEKTDFTPNSAREAFYYVVRFHKGKPEFIYRVTDIIRKYSHINSQSLNVISYVNSIMNLYNDIVRDFNKEQNKKRDKEIKNDNNDNNSTGDPSNGSGAGNGEDDTLDTSVCDLTEEEVNNIINELDINLKDSDIKNIIKDALDTSVNKYYDPQLTASLAQIIQNKLKQKNANGAAINSYSGRLDIRAVSKRDDYKWWAQQNRAGHIKMYSKVHFNLYLDNSGSFRNNDTNMNKFIQALNKIVSSDFEFDVITINSSIKEWANTTDQLFHSGGGTYLSRSIEQVVKRHIVPRANNYNIVLFDGDASPDELRGSNAFMFFDTPNSVIVTDYDNKKYTDVAIKKARVITTDDYCNKFINAVLVLMEQVL